MLVLARGATAHRLRTALRAHELVGGGTIPTGPEDVLGAPFDLVLAGGRSLSRHAAPLRAARAAAAPGLLPILLVGRRPPAGCEDIVDDFLDARAPAAEIRARVGNLLHLRRLTLAPSGRSGERSQPPQSAVPAEQAVRQSEARFRALVETSTDLFSLVGPDGRAFYASPQAETFFGWPAEEVPHVDWVAAVHPDDRALVLANFTRLLEEPGLSITIDLRMRHRDGSWHWFESHGCNRFDNPDLRALVVITRDITARRRAEEEVRGSDARFELAVESSAVGLWEWDVETHHVSIGPRRTAWLGYDEREVAEILARDWTSVIHPDDLERMLRTVQQYVEQPDSRFELEFRLRHHDGTYHWLVSRGTMVHDPQGGSPRMLGIILDITARKQAEEELARSREQLRALSARVHAAVEEQRTRIAREIHDDCGQALTALKLELAWLRGRLTMGAPPVGRRTLARRTRGMMRLLDEAVGTVRRAASELRPGVLDDLGLPAAIDWLLRDTESRSGIRCSFTSRMTAELDRPIATALFRIVQEALTNVVRHANARHVAVALADDGDQVEVEVVDDGRGITDGERNSADALGLLGMTERARLLGGDLTVGRVAASRGTAVVARIPLPSGPSDALALQHRRVT